MSTVAVLQFTPVTGNWEAKRIVLDEAKVVGRLCLTPETIPTVDNGYFDSKVLSRKHALIWAEGGKIFLKDTKSFNGTYVNGKRLSKEAEESEPVELKGDDIVEFGKDVFAEDKTMINHHKIVARVVL